MNISFCNKHKMLSHLELNFKRRIIVVEVRFENYTWILFVMRLYHILNCTFILIGSYDQTYTHVE